MSDEFNLQTFLQELRDLALDKPPYRGRYSGAEMIGIHVFVKGVVIPKLEGFEKQLLLREAEHKANPYEYWKKHGGVADLIREILGVDEAGEQ